MTGVEMTQSIEQLKAEARRLRDSLTGDGTPVSHSRSLELVARQKGYRDWNTAHAALGNRPPAAPVALGESVSGTYLGQRFTGTVIGINGRPNGGRWRVTLQLDAPVDVVKFDSFSSFRHRLTATINAEGRTVEKTSNGQPHLVVDLI